MIACALKETPVSTSGSMHGASNEFTINFICFLCVLTSFGPEDRNPLFFTISVEETLSFFCIPQISYDRKVNEGMRYTVSMDKT